MYARNCSKRGKREKPLNKKLKLIKIFSVKSFSSTPFCDIGKKFKRKSNRGYVGGRICVFSCDRV